MLQRREVLTGCRCTHIMEMMLRIPTPMPTSNQDASRDERQVLLIRNCSACNEHRKILFFLPVSSDTEQNPLSELSKSSSLSELAEVWSHAWRLGWPSTKPEPLDPWIFLGNPANSSFPLHESLAMFTLIAKPFNTQVLPNWSGCDKLLFQVAVLEEQINPSWQTLNHHPIN